MNIHLIRDALHKARGVLITASLDTPESVASVFRSSVIQRRIELIDLALSELRTEASPEDVARAEADRDLADATNALVAAAHGASTAAGWWTDPISGQDYGDIAYFPFVVGTKLMLMVSEIAEAMEGHRKGLNDDKLPHRTMIEVELADAMLRIADLAGKLGCDLGGALVEKMRFNAVRPDHKPGARMMAGGKAY